MQNKNKSKTMNRSDYKVSRVTLGDTVREKVFDDCEEESILYAPNVNPSEKLRTGVGRRKLVSVISPVNKRALDELKKIVETP
jgi:hypothetical protein